MNKTFTQTVFDEDDLPIEVMPSVHKMEKDLKAVGAGLSQQSARLLVDRYYQTQKDRIRAEHQARMAVEAGEPSELLDFFAAQALVLENQIKSALDKYSAGHPVGAWMRKQKGIGPVIAAGLLAHIDMTKAPTVGHIWSFAGLDPNAVWAKGERRPWNTDLKTLTAFKLGEGFVKTCNYDDAFYGKIYKAQKEFYIKKNEEGGFAQAAARALSLKKYGADTVARKFYEDGKLPPAHIHAMARRYAVKIFLSHLHEVWHWHEFGTAPPVPFVIEHLGHIHRVDPPQWEKPVS